MLECEFFIEYVVYLIRAAAISVTTRKTHRLLSFEDEQAAFSNKCWSDNALDGTVTIEYLIALGDPHPWFSPPSAVAQSIHPERVSLHRSRRWSVPGRK